MRGGGVLQNLMLSSDLLKSKIPICEGGGVGGTKFPTFDAESKFVKKIFFFAKLFLSFRAKIGTVFVLGFEYRVVRLYFV